MPDFWSGRGTNFQALQLSFRTQRWTLLDDDIGVDYASSTQAEQNDIAERLYTVTAQGNLLELNQDSGSFAHTGKTLSATLDPTYEISISKIRSPGTVIFCPKLLSEPIRFMRPAEEIDVIRTITKAGNDFIEFDPVDGLQDGDMFRIAAVRFRLRWAHLAGRRKTTTKTIQGVHVAARKGIIDTEGTLTLRSFEDLTLTTADKSTVPIYNPEESGRQTEDRVSSLAGQGSFLEFRIEQVEPNIDFTLETIEVLVEESDTLSDTES